VVATRVEYDTITMTRHDDGTVTVHGFPERVLISAALLPVADESLLTLDVSPSQFLMHFSFNNGAATYQVIGYESPCFVAELQTRTMY
jgi:hypothetical protein